MGRILSGKCPSFLPFQLCAEASPTPPGSCASCASHRLCLLHANGDTVMCAGISDTPSAVACCMCIPTVLMDSGNGAWPPTCLYDAPEADVMLGCVPRLLHDAVETHTASVLWRPAVPHPTAHSLGEQMHLALHVQRRCVLRLPVCPSFSHFVV